MREKDVPRERWRNAETGTGTGMKDSGTSDKVVAEAEGLGTNEGTVRFLFCPPGSVLAG